ncbi:hypothetical protein evm_012921 [Chilo suppressalis]|nr:hypothetical protein evm_012921 [Chilo suppressalis]
MEHRSAFFTKFGNMSIPQALKTLLDWGYVGSYFETPAVEVDTLRDCMEETSLKLESSEPSPSTPPSACRPIRGSPAGVSRGIAGTPQTCAGWPARGTMRCTGQLGIPAARVMGRAQPRRALFLSCPLFFDEREKPGNHPPAPSRLPPSAR